MSVTLSRFVKVMTDGRIVTDKLVAKQESRLAARIGTLRAATDTLDRAKIPTGPQVQQRQKLEQLLAAAQTVTKDNAKRSDLLDKANAIAKAEFSAARTMTAAAMDTVADRLQQQIRSIPNAQHQGIAQTRLDELKRRRASLGDASGDHQQQLQWLKDADAASRWCQEAIDFGSGLIKSCRDQAREGGDLYLRAGQRMAQDKDPETSRQGKELVRLAQNVRTISAAAEQKGKTEPGPATLPLANLFAAAESDYAKAKAIYQKCIVAPDVLPKSRKAIAADPQGVDAAMSKALSPAVFNERLIELNTVAKMYGVDISAMPTGESVALFSYTTGDYKQINKFLLEGTTGDPAEDSKAKATIAAANKAMARLAPVTVESDRGEKPWDGAAAQYRLGNVFTVPTFWSTGIGYSLSGAWQITVRGKKGKNVAGFSNFPHESEVLFPPGSKFRVLRLTLAESGNRVVVEEVT